MTSSRLVRGAKTRTIGCICLVLLLGALVYLFQGTQSRLADVQKIANTCSQQAESLSAQLEVLFEYKLRLEKSLQSEKQEKKKLLEEIEKVKIDRESKENEKAELSKKLENLAQDKNNLQAKMEDSKDNYEKQLTDLNSENNVMKNSLRSLKDDLEKASSDRDNFRNSMEKLKEEVEKLKTDAEDLKMKNLPSNEQVEKLENDKKELRDKLNKTEKALANCLSNDEPVERMSPPPLGPVGASSGAAGNNKMDDKRFLEPPAMIEEPENGSKGSSSTTPGINPQALYTQDSSTKTSTKQTQENKPEPLPQPASNNGGGMGPGVGQIPLPPDDSPAVQNKIINIEDAHANQIDAWDDQHRGDMNNAALEDLGDAPLQGEEDRAPKSRDYPEKEYKEDQGDEDDEEEERMGEFSHQSSLRREPQLVKFSNMEIPDGGGGGGVMVNPK